MKHGLFAKIVVFFMVLGLICCTNTNSAVAFAASRMEIPENAVSVTVVSNEAEYLLELLNSTDEELIERGLSDEEIVELRNYDYKSDLMRLQEKETLKLQKAGFSDEQINRIRAYNGQENAVEYVATYDLSNATLSGNFWVNPVSVGKSVEIMYAFTWSQAPIFRSRDNIGIGWVLCDANSHMILPYVRGEEHTVDYSLLGEDEYAFWDTPYSVKEDWDYAREIEFDMHREIERTQYTEEYFAKHIWGCIIVETMAGSYNLSHLMVQAVYGHTIIGASASLNIDLETGGLSLSITPSWRHEELFNGNRTYDAEGNVA